MTTAYVQEARQRFTEFGGFTVMEPAADSLATWADCLLVRVETGLTTLVAIMAVGPEGATKAVRDDLTIMADRIARQERVEVQVLLLLVSAEPLTRSAYDRWQELKVSRGNVRLVPWIVDLTREQVFAHQGPPFGIDPDLETLAAPEPRCEEGEAPKPQAEPHRPVAERDEPPRPWATIVLLTAIIGIWLAMTVAGRSLTATEDMEILNNWGAVFRPFMWRDGQYWRLFTAAFLHIGLAHLAMNGLSLWMVGRAVEWLYGPLRMLYIYVAAAVTGSLLSAALGQPVVLSAGASGAIFGMLGAIIWYRLSSPLGARIKMRPLLTTLVMNLGLSLAMYKVIDNWNHLGGLLGGFVAAAVIGVPAIHGLQAPRWRFGRTWHIAGTALITLALAGYLTGLLVPPGPGQRLAAALEAYEDGRFDEAETGVEAAVERQEDEPWLRYVLTAVYLDQGKCAQAQAQVIQLRSLEPEYEHLRELEALVKKCR
ncbi:MAG TPA: rhomboid family intramembrane serine protease [Symbiobacteriaceae bacterium]|nr:rhomboid family intramembrane serine protease [Symbiobacteriaceae bacterium]